MKKFLTWVCLAVVLFALIYGAVVMGTLPRTYEGGETAISVYQLQQNPSAFDVSHANGAADAIIQENLDRTHAVNDVTSIVFDFRGYDTMGEAFILITAVAGSTVILFTKALKKEEKADEK